MKPSDITREMADIYLLAFEFRTLDCRAMQHDAHAGVQRSRGRSGCDPRIDWAIDYLFQLYRMKPYERELVDRAHRDGGEMTLSQARKCARYLEIFYRRVRNSRLYGDGMRWLRIVSV